MTVSRDALTARETAAVVTVARAPVAVALHERAFRAMGTACGCSPPTPRSWIPRAAEVERLAAVLTRFDPRSELSRLNADPRRVVAGLRDAARGGAGGAGGAPRGPAAWRTRRCSARSSVPATRPRSRDGRGCRWPLRSLRRRRAVRPRRTRTRAGARSAWTTTHAASSRPPGVRLDLGGSAKGFVADRVAALPRRRRARARSTAVATCASTATHAVRVLHPVTGEVVAVLAPPRRSRRDLGASTRGCGSAPPAPAITCSTPDTAEPAWTGVMSGDRARAVGRGGGGAGEGRAAGGARRGPDGARRRRRDGGRDPASRGGGRMTGRESRMVAA